MAPRPAPCRRARTACGRQLVDERVVGVRRASHDHAAPTFLDRGGGRCRAGSGSPTSRCSGNRASRPCTRVDPLCARHPGAPRARRLVDDDHVVVLVDDVDLDLGIGFDDDRSAVGVAEMRTHVTASSPGARPSSRPGRRCAPRPAAMRSVASDRRAPVTSATIRSIRSPAERLGIDLSRSTRSSSAPSGRRARRRPRDRPAGCHRPRHRRRRR